MSKKYKKELTSAQNVDDINTSDEDMGEEMSTTDDEEEEEEEEETIKIKKKKSEKVNKQRIKSRVADKKNENKNKSKNKAKKERKRNAKSLDNSRMEKSYKESSKRKGKRKRKKKDEDKEDVKEKDLKEKGKGKGNGKGKRKKKRKRKRNRKEKKKQYRVFKKKKQNPDYSIKKNIKDFLELEYQQMIDELISTINVKRREAFERDQVSKKKKAFKKTKNFEELEYDTSNNLIKDESKEKSEKVKTIINSTCISIISDIQEIIDEFKNLNDYMNDGAPIDTEVLEKMLPFTNFFKIKK